MEDNWFSEYAEELGRCLEDARACAEACEHLLESLDDDEDHRVKRTVVRTVLGPAAVSRVLIDLIDQPMEIVLAAARLCSDTGRDAAEVLQGLDDGRTQEAVAALQACAASCAALVNAV